MEKVFFPLLSLDANKKKTIWFNAGPEMRKTKFCIMN